MRAPKYGVYGFKIIWLDSLKAELACAFHPMTEDHPLYQVVEGLGLDPESYPVEVLRPLVFMRGQPDLLYEQPDVLRPFTLALSDLSLLEWIALFPGGLSPGQLNLHDKALKEVHDEIETVTMHDLYVKVQEIVERGTVGYGTHIKGMEKTPTIPMSKRVFGAREAQGLLQKYTVLMDTSLIMPKIWKGQPVSTNLDLGAVMEDQETLSVFYLAPYKELPHLNYGVINYILSHILDLKSPNNPERVTSPVCLAFPELKNFCPKHIPDRARYYVEPVKNTMLTLVSQGAGLGISVDSDSQFFDQVPDEYRTNVNVSFVFDLGEEAGEKIRELVKNRTVSNFKEITDEHHLSALRDAGTFIYLGYGETRAEIRRGAVVSFWYPRARTGEQETETNFYDLFQRNYPDRMVNLFPAYTKLMQINMDAQRVAAKEMITFLDGKEKENAEKRKGWRAKADETMRMLGKALQVLAENDGLTVQYTPTITKLTYYQPEGHSEPLLNMSVNNVRMLLRKAENQGLCFVDKSPKRGQWKLIINKARIDEFLAEAEN